MGKIGTQRLNAFEKLAADEIYLNIRGLIKHKVESKTKLYTDKREQTFAKNRIVFEVYKKLQLLVDDLTNMP